MHIIKMLGIGAVAVIASDMVKDMDFYKQSLADAQKAGAKAGTEPLTAKAARYGVAGAVVWAGVKFLG